MFYSLLIINDKFKRWFCKSPVTVQWLSRVRLFAIPWTVAHQASLSFAISQRLLKLKSLESGMLSNHLIFCHLLLFLPSIFPSIRVFPNEPVLCIRQPKYIFCLINWFLLYPYQMDIDKNIQRKKNGDSIHIVKNKV